MSELIINPETCEHEWRVESDFIGDCDVINGTMDVFDIHCELCGAECTDENLAQKLIDSHQSSYEDISYYDY